MKKLTHLVATIAIAATAIIGIASVHPDQVHASTKPVKIGIIQFSSQSALADTRKGFTQELAKHGYKDGKNIQLNLTNAQGDQSTLQTMTQKLRDDNNAFNLAIATPAAQAMQKADPKTPMLFAAITDPVNAGLVNTRQHPDKNASGVTDTVDFKAQIDMLHRMFPKAKKIGFIYNAAEINSVLQVKRAGKEAKRLGLTTVSKTAATTNDVEQATETLTHQADAIYVPQDNVAAAGMTTIGKVAEKAKVPVMTADATMVKKAGTATIGHSFKQQGAQVADMAIKLIKGKQIKNMPVENPNKTQLVTDKHRMKLFHVKASALK